MTFQQTIDYLYSRLPVFQNLGARAYKPGLTTTRQFCHYLGNPQTKYKTIHIAGTNGKGSTSHMLAAVLQKAGYKVGLYTSPHLKTFTERIRVNGQEATGDYVVEFVRKHREFIETSSPSFFEVTVAMAFDYFARQEVDVAVIEVGMGGRLDSTNIIEPEVSIITNISFDHMLHLGDTLPKIAAEKAGIIKAGVPVVVSEQADSDVLNVFKTVASQANATLYPAYDLIEVISHDHQEGYLRIQYQVMNGEEIEEIELDLMGDYQLSNFKGVLVALGVLREKGFVLIQDHIREGLRSVTTTTGLKGRWQVLQRNPMVVCDTAHNFAGLKFTISQLMAIPHAIPRFVLGFVADKELDQILPLFPKNGAYYYCQPSNPRALSADLLAAKGKELGLTGVVIQDVNQALDQAILEADKNDVIYVGGSTFVVADLTLI